MSDPSDVESDAGEPRSITIAFTLVGFYSTFGYATCGLIRSLLGKSGVPLSPLAAYGLLSLLMLPIFRIESRLQRRSDWGRIKERWFKFGGALLLLVMTAPVILGVTMPWAVLGQLSPAACGWLCVLPLGLLFGRIYWLVRRRRSKP